MAAPAFNAAGTFAASEGPVVVPLPTHTAGDRLILFVETASESLSGPIGWDNLGGVPTRGSPGATNATRLLVFTRTAQSGDLAPTLEDSGDHQVACILSFTPSEVHADQIGTAAAATTHTLPSLTTTVDDCLIIAVLGTPDDNADTNRVTAWSNSFAERFDRGSAVGNGGGIAIATRVLATAGPVGATEATMAASTSMVAKMIALKSPAPTRRPIRTFRWL